MSAGHTHDFDPANNVCRTCRYQRAVGEAVVSYGGGISGTDNNAACSRILGKPAKEVTRVNLETEDR